MAFGNNRAAARPGADVRPAGGVIMKYRHPFLAYMISSASPVDEIDVSGCVRLNDTFLDARPSQDSSYQEVLIDGSTITITNHLLNGTMTLPVLPTAGTVAGGDLIEAAKLVQSSKDDVGGTFTTIEFINGKRLVTVFYGVTWKNIPHKILAGNAVPIYPLVLAYSGWVAGLSGTENIQKAIWAVGSKYGLKAQYKPYSIQQQEDNDFYKGRPLGIIPVTGANYNDTDESDAEVAVGEGADGIEGDITTINDWS